MTLKGVCPQCGAVYFGWALTQPEGQFCNQCGSPLLISISVENKIKGREPWERTTWWEEIFKAIKPWGLQ